MIRRSRAGVNRAAARRPTVTRRRRRVPAPARRRRRCRSRARAASACRSAAAGSRNVISSKWALKSRRNDSSRSSSPCAVWASSSSPFRKTPIARAPVLSQSRRVMRRPSGRIHHTSGSCSPCPPKKRVRRNTGCGGRSSISRSVNSSSSMSQRIPVEPRELVVLAPRVVVAVLRAAQLVAAEQHRHALREQQRRQEVALLARAQRVDRGIVGRPFDAAVPRAVVVGAVVVVLAVRLVVLVVVRDEIARA